MYRAVIVLQVYKMNLVDVRAPAGQAVDSARQNLANTFVNAFVNAGFGQDKLMTAVPNADGASSDNVHWIFKNKVSPRSSVPMPAIFVCVTLPCKQCHLSQFADCEHWS